MTVRGLFTAADGRLNAPWRLLLFAGVVFVAIELATAVLYPPLSALARATDTHLVVYEWLTLVGLLAAHAAQLAWVERRPWSFVGLGRAAARPRLVGLGVALGGLAIAVPSLALTAVGQYRIVGATGVGGGWWDASLASLVLLVPAAIVEELLMRGYLFAVLREIWGWRATLVASSIVFGALHLANSGWTIGSISMVMLGGFFLGGVLLATGSLYASIGAHLAWNAVMGLALHAPVSGYPLETPAYRLVDAGPAWLTGGAWGPEGGLAAGVGMALGLWYLSWYARRRPSGELPDAATVPQGSVAP